MEDRFKVHLFTSERSESDDLVMEIEWINRFFRAGLDILHLRKPSLGAEETARIISDIDRRFRHRIVLHDHPELALKFGCGFQFNRRNRAEASSFQIHSLSGQSLSSSCHSLDECRKCVDMDFVTLSPIFDSISKERYNSAVDITALHGVDLNGIVALGGVTLERLGQLKQLGFSGAALLGEVWNHSEGPQRFLKYLLMRNFPLQFITNANDVAQTIAQARSVIESGGRWVQVRMKENEIAEISEALQELYPYCEETGTTLIVDDHYELIHYCHGVHLGQEDAPVAEVRAAVGAEKIIGLTANNASHIEASKKALPDYYGVGPFRYTTTKKRLAPMLGLEGYRRLAPVIRQMERPFVAIGGILLDDVKALLEAGTDGVAVSGCITKAPDSGAITKKLLNEIYGK